MTWYVCDEVGHFASKCPNKKKKHKKRCSNQQNKTSEDWFIDSGASAHMTMNNVNMLGARACNLKNGKLLWVTILIYMLNKRGICIKIRVGSDSSFYSNSILVKGALHKPDIMCKFDVG